SYLLLVLVVAGLILIFMLRSFNAHSIEASTRNLHRVGLALGHQIRPLMENERPEELDTLITAVGKDIQARITIIDSQGKVLADSGNTASSMENHRHRPEVLAALTGSAGSSIRYSTTLDKDMLYVSLPLESTGRMPAALRLSIPLENIHVLLSAMRKDSLMLASAIILFSLLIALLFSHAVSSPIRLLSRASRRLAEGDFKSRVRLKTNDEIQELAESFNDMTERLEISFAELSSNKEELEGIVSSMSEALLALDDRGRVRLANRSAGDLFGTEKVIGRYSWELIRAPELNGLIERASQQPAAESIDLEDKTYLCSVTPIRSGKAKVILLHDITEMRRLEKIKKDLVVNVSHELRTPLTAIKGFTETLMEESTDSHLEYLKVIKNHTDRLINIITDLLELSKLEAGEFRLDAEDVPLRALIESVLALFGPALTSKNLTAGIEGPQQDVIIKGDPFLLEQLFTNLIDNAVKYTEKGGITISLGSSQNIAVVKVTDTGIGIPREHLGRIFERFYVVDKSRSRRLGGTGLGLSIVKHIVTLHKGAISVTSRPYGGTAFTITLPLAALSSKNATG
ncbi:MAG TPA: ATP-binding protein, partial [Deltaproteobacteria bacterium]|nr:ATP-binding protein [Deltaproteobacteria bacterium]